MHTIDGVIIIVEKKQNARFKSRLTKRFSKQMTASANSDSPGPTLKIAEPFTKETSSSSPLKLVEPQGQLQVHTASYRGSFSVVLSEALRAAGLGSRVLIVQFLKGGVQQGPKHGVNLCGRLEWLRPAIESCMTESNQSVHELETMNAVQDIWEVCKQRLFDNIVDRIVLDEVGLAISMGLLNENDFISTLERRPPATDVVLTGPAIPSQIMDLADQITELRC